LATSCYSPGSVRLRIISVMSGEMDGISLAQFRVGETYDVGTAVGSYLLALGAAVPVIDEAAAAVVRPDLTTRRDRRGVSPKRPRKMR
jgi:hypothetical protein